MPQVLTVAHGFSCSEARGVLVSQPGVKPTFPALEGGFLTAGLPGTSPDRNSILNILRNFI